ncbi:MAG: cytochrome c maturation protein CcmE [Deltaproteobacteria bacterium]|nr:cytochrome c maturation protein CcmE [Deltaproteobacteria bacterium]MBW2417821.1 cytochrome c maturation protein CcmE [Deltaproteobacteria bacterium]
MSKGAQIAVGAILIGALLAWYGYTNLDAESTFQYYQSLEEFLAAETLPEGKSLRVHGYVALESIERDLEGRQVRFRVVNDPPHAAGDKSGRTLAVLYRSLETPDLFKDGAEVVVEGTFERQGDEAVFLADNVLAKCPSKFEANKPGGA